MAYSEPSQTSKMKFFAKIVNGCSPILHGLLGFEYASISAGIDANNRCLVGPHYAK